MSLKINTLIEHRNICIRKVTRLPGYYNLSKFIYLHRYFDKDCMSRQHVFDCMTKIDTIRVLLSFFIFSFIYILLFQFYSLGNVPSQEQFSGRQELFRGIIQLGNISRQKFPGSKINNSMQYQFYTTYIVFYCILYNIQ